MVKNGRRCQETCRRKEFGGSEDGWERWRSCRRGIVGVAAASLSERWGDHGRVSVRDIRE